MLDLSTDDKSFRLIILESANFEELKKGRPAQTTDGRVAIAWTPDPAWLSARIEESDGDLDKIMAAIEESLQRPQAPVREQFEPIHRRFRTR